MKTALELISMERTRQVFQEGFTPEHDDQYTGHELALAAVAYAKHAAECGWIIFDNRSDRPCGLDRYSSAKAPEEWPWEERWWKPTRPIRDLVKAAALIVAEIERLQRIEAGESMLSEVTP